MPWVLHGTKLTVMRNTAPTPASIAVVTVDCLPAWMIPASGCTWVAMPALDALAGRGIVFDRVMATSDDVLGTLAALAGSGLTAARSSSLPVLASSAERGRATVLVTDDTTVAAMAVEPTDVRLVPPFVNTVPAVSAADTTLGRLFEAATTVVAGGECQFLWCHASSLGVAWDAPLSFRDRYIDPDDPPPPSGTGVPIIHAGPETDPDILVAIRHAFAAQLTLLDHCLGILLAAITSRAEPWTILVAGTRGLGLGLHGVVGPTQTLPYSEVMQLTAILVDHRRRMAGQRYGGLLIPDDLGATILDMLGCPPEPSTDPRRGRSLGSLLNSWLPPDRDRVIARSTQGTAVSTPSWHLVQPNQVETEWPRAQIFSKPDDFFEACDVADRCPAVADELASRARGNLEEAWTTPLSPEAIHGT